ncbi:protein Skeletor, isoforms B/C isoform X1 [Anopheles moucheti]|uniref:protein Skeletor, isoforms B/C isoform X1 n=1 Tax=Anopheles moucheti TaxID=186751 RepID=UPI0022F00A4F|nr:protein Skeletor, isoforms B/C isoform X1 [Anopheles moucheti]
MLPTSSSNDRPRSRVIVFFAGILLICFLTKQTSALQGYYGTKIADLTELHHGVSGSVYAVDARTLFLKNFNYDGEGPAAYFYVGNTRAPSNKGAHRLRDERGRAGVLRRYRNEDITLSLPEGKTLRDIRWFAVWCDDFSVNFGDVQIRNDLDFPRPTKIAGLSGVHDVTSDNIVIVDAQTLLVPNFSYDGEAPDAKFWVGRGPAPTSQGIRIPDENGKETPLRRYDKKTIVLTLPGDLTVFDIGHFGVWCEAFTVDFGHVRIPDQINVPPSLKMLGISPQSKLNCEVLLDELAFEVRWAVAGESVVVQLVAKLDDGEYMSFGVSPNPQQSQMVGADVAVVWVDKATGKGYAQDYYLDAKSQCSGGRGSCPDTRITENSNSIRLLNAAMVNGYSIVTYQRPLRASDHLDLPVYTNASQAIIWAVGPLNQRYEVSYHSHYLKGNKLVDFGRQPFWNCPTPESDQKQPEQPQKLSSASSSYGGGNRREDAGNSVQQQRPQLPATARPPAKPGAWDIPPIQCYEPEDGVFYAQMGPTGGKQGYPAITGHVGWGISWYINGLLIPEINVVRGKTYTFVVEGGLDPNVPAKYHPFYITDDSVGGYEHQSEEDRKNIRIFAGVHRSRSGKLVPTGIGRLCNWTPNPDGPPSDEYPSFGAYQRSLSLKCDVGEPGIITWTPDADTPDTVYYQCFTHRYLGWRINVHDACDVAQPSELDEVYAEPNEGISVEESIRHESKVLPADNFLQQHENFLQKHELDLIKHHKMTPDTKKEQSFDINLEENPEMTRIIEDGIRAAEELEEKLRANQTVESVNQTVPHQHHPGHPSFIPGPPGHRHPPPPGYPGSAKPILSSSGLPVYLRPPNSGPMFRPVKLPVRRPIGMERRPMHGSRPTRPFVIPQPSMIVSHYQKPVAPLMRPFVTKGKMPIKAIAPILLLGEPTEIKPFRKGPSVEMMVAKPPKQISGGEPRPGSSPGGPPFALPEMPPHLTMSLKKNEPVPITLPVRHTKPVKESHKPNIKPIFKTPYDVSEPKVSYEGHAANHGFEPSSVVVESGFKPIYRRKDDYDLEFEDNRAHGFLRRQDDDIDEAIESDALIIHGQDEPSKQTFEPMFIPSPLDSMAMAHVKPSAGPARESATKRNVEILPDETADVVGEGQDSLGAANDRVDPFYLPPIGSDGSVVSFDGKAVLDMSLVNGPGAVSHQSEPLPPVGPGSKSEQLLRETPQFGPFRGEYPPIAAFLAPDTAAIYGTRGSNAVQPPVSEYANPLLPGGINAQDSASSEHQSAAVGKPISTKLSIVKPVANSQEDPIPYEETESEAGRARSKRSPHHHPDHHGDSHDDGWQPMAGGGNGVASSWSKVILGVLCTAWSTIVLRRAVLL